MMHHARINTPRKPILDSKTIITTIFASSLFLPEKEIEKIRICYR